MAQIRYYGELVEMPDHFCAWTLRWNRLFNTVGFQDAELERELFLRGEDDEDRRLPGAVSLR